MTDHDMAPPASPAVRHEWLRRVEAEYRSAVFAQHLTLWLMQIGAPPDLLEAGLRIAADELAHSEASHEVYLAAGGDRPPNINRASLCLPEEEPLEIRIARHGVEIFCIGETVAVRLFRRLRAGCAVAVARRALDRILRDEVFHRDFGWTLLEWLLDSPHAAQTRALLAGEVEDMLTQVRKHYGALEAAGERAAPDVADDERAWGLMPRGEYAEAVEDTFARDYQPRFASLGIAIGDV